MITQGRELKTWRFIFLTMKATQEGRALADASARLKDNVVPTCWTYHHWVMATGHRNTLES